MYIFIHHKILAAEDNRVNKRWQEERDLQQSYVHSQNYDIQGPCPIR